MKVTVHPTDRWACGSYRMAWPGEELRRQGHDVTVAYPDSDGSEGRLGLEMEYDQVIGVQVPEGVDVVVLQRVTHRWLVEGIRHLRARGIAVVVDIDDDLDAIDQGNPAFWALHPRNEGRRDKQGKPVMTSWRHLTQACQEATLVTATTESLIRRYAPHGRGRVLPNYVPAHYLDVQHTDSDLVGWPAAIHSHPNDPEVAGPSISRLVREGMPFRVFGDPTGVGRAFGLPADPEGGKIALEDWPQAISELGVGIAPFADTRFNQSKSWLKGIELSSVGVPWVASPRPEYVRLHEMGAGILARRPRDWYREVRSLWRNPARRLELSQAGRDVAQQLRLDANAWRWMEAWSDALEIERGASRLTTHPAAR